MLTKSLLCLAAAGVKLSQAQTTTRGWTVWPISDDAYPTEAFDLDENTSDSGYIVFNMDYVASNPNLTVHKSQKHYYTGNSRFLIYGNRLDGTKLSGGKRNKPDWGNANNFNSNFLSHVLRHKYCKAFFNSTVGGAKYDDIDPDNPNRPSKPNKDCSGTWVQFALRRYACNCFPDLFDGMGTAFDEGHMNWRFKQIGVKTLHMGNTGDPIDWLDAACQRTYFRESCVVQDLEKGWYDLAAPADRIYNNPNQRDMTYEDRKNWCENQDSGFVTARNKTLGITQEDIDRTQGHYDFNRGGWQEQCCRIPQYECGRNLQYPYFVDDDGYFHCGWEDNPDYANGTPEGEECQRDMCLIHKQFADEVIDGLIERGYTPNHDPLSGRAGLWKYLEDNRHNYFTYQNHINVTSGQTESGTGRYDGGGENNYSPWLVEWDMNWDTAGNQPKYFPDTYPWPPAAGLPRSNFDRQVPHCTHWNEDYSIAPQMCFHKAKTLETGQLERQCCGQQPHRYPYQPAHKQCCEGKVRDFGTC